MTWNFLKLRQLNNSRAPFPVKVWEHRPWRVSALRLFWTCLSSFKRWVQLAISFLTVSACFLVFCWWVCGVVYFQCSNILWKICIEHMINTRAHPQSSGRSFSFPRNWNCQRMKDSQARCSTWFQFLCISGGHSSGFRYILDEPTVVNGMKLGSRSQTWNTLKDTESRNQ